MINIEPPSSSLALDALPTLNSSGLARFLNRARRAVGLAGEVEVALTSDAVLKRLNRRFRGKNQATDVLSFPAPAELSEVTAGDLAISLDTAARQALEHGHSLRDEVRILLLHGLLHLDGGDHETDDGAMAEREAELRRELRLPTGLIERVHAPARTPAPARVHAPARTPAPARVHAPARTHAPARVPTPLARGGRGR